MRSAPAHNIYDLWAYFQQGSGRETYRDDDTALTKGTKDNKSILEN